MPPPPRPTAADYVSLRDYFDTTMEARDKTLEVALRNLDHRLGQMNEFRNALRDQSMTFLTKAEYITFKENLEADIRSLRESRAELAGKADQKQVNDASTVATIGIILSVIGLAVAIVSIVIKL